MHIYLYTDLFLNLNRRVAEKYITAMCIPTRHTHSHTQNNMTKQHTQQLEGGSNAPHFVLTIFHTHDIDNNSQNAF